MRIIVNADDLGISEPVNEAIFAGMQRGTITSATLLANGPAVEAAAGKVQHFPNCSFGIHLNVTEFAPVAQASLRDLTPILDNNQRFNGNAIREVPLGLGMLRAIYSEWCCQIDRLIRLGVEPTHFDAHHHVHTIPQIFPVLAALRQRYKINKIRISRNMYEDSNCPSSALLAKKRFYNQALRTIGFRTTKIFTEFLTFFHLCAERPPRQESVELMTHPGSSPGNEEAKLLESDWPRRLFYQVALVSYKNL
jgi:chitin disaccharide deacetylase